MADPKQQFNAVFYQALYRYFAERLPEDLGLALYSAIAQSMRFEGLLDSDHVQEVAQRTLVAAVDWLEKHGGESIDDLPGWTHDIRRQQTRLFLTDYFHSDRAGIEEVLSGAHQLSTASLSSASEVAELIYQSMVSLPTHHRELIHLDLVLRLEPHEIMQRLGIQTEREFRRRKLGAFNALKLRLQAYLP